MPSPLVRTKLHVPAVRRVTALGHAAPRVGAGVLPLQMPYPPLESVLATLVNDLGAHHVDHHTT